MSNTQRKARDTKYQVGKKYSYSRPFVYAEFIVTDIRMPSLITKTVYIYYEVTKGIITGTNSFIRESEFDKLCFAL